MKKLNNIPSFTLPVLALVIIASLLLIFEADLLWKTQETNLFLDTKLFFKEMMVEPGGFLSWVSAYFTQFFFYPWVGVLLLCAWWLLLMWLLKRTFRLSGWWMALTVIPVLFLLVTIVDMGYWIYILKLRGHVFLGTIGTTAVVALLWAFRALTAVQLSLRLKPLLLAGFVLATCFLGYPLMGIYGLGATVLMAVWVWRLEPHRLSAVAVSLTGLLSVWLLPLFFYRYVYYQTNVANIYVAKLPLYYVQEEYFSYYVPFLLLLAFFLVMVVASRPTPSPSLQGGEQIPGRQVKAKGKEKSGKVAYSKVTSPLPAGRGWGRVLALILLLAAAVYTYANWFRDENFHHELSMQRSIEQQDWEGVLKEAAKQEDEPTRAIVTMRNLALSRLGRQGDEMFLYKNGSKDYASPWGVRMMLVNGPMLYFEYGMLNYCHRLSMEMGVEFGWSAQDLKLMAKSAMLSGEQQLARKYIGLLRQTTFFDDWAEWAEQMLRHPEQRAADPALGPVLHMLHYSDKLTADQGNVERFIMQQLVTSTSTDDPVFQEQTLLASLYTHDPNHFWYHFRDYVHLHPNARVPRYYQEAAYLYTYLQDGDTNALPFDRSVVEGFNRFMQAAARFEGAQVEVGRKGLYGQFGQTYFYDYYMMSQLPEY